jgi:protein TonB
LFAELIAPPAPDTAPKALPEPAPVKLQPARKPVIKPKQERLVTKSPAPAKQELATPEPSPEPVVEQVESAPVVSAPAPMPTGPVTLSSELSVSCPRLTPPEYPAISRRMGEEGKLVLRVELDESGRIDDAKVINSSGYERLDAAALTAVKSWQCNPSLRNGQPVRAIALQPFNFVLQGN